MVRLLDDGKAFKCYCDTARLDAMRREQIASGAPLGYNGHCLNLSATELKALEIAGAPYTVRMKVPVGGSSQFRDMLRGDIEVPWSAVDMQILMKSDGLPTYHLANVVDDHHMGITHVLRGEEWIPSAPKHQLLYQYFGWEMPVLCHLPLLRNPDRSKLSKRKNPTSVDYYRSMGYAPEALLAMLGGYLTKDGAEDLASLEQLEADFSLDSISLSGPIFDVEKLDWLNGRFLRERLDPQSFLVRYGQWANDTGRVSRAAEFVHSRVAKFSDVADLAAFLFSGRLEISPEDFADPKLSDEERRFVLQAALWKLNELRVWDETNISSTIRSFEGIVNKKLKVIMRPLYVAIAGRPQSLPLFSSMAVLGRDMCRFRLRAALDLLGLPTAAETREWRQRVEGGADAAVDGD